ncbi:MAG: hypothetical protein JRI53_07465 [Deltaproteobacteria bacterium]|nr:hypothetical protein [Deltaproteobacteria bacterium]
MAALSKTAFQLVLYPDLIQALSVTDEYLYLKQRDVFKERRLAVFFF